MKNTELQQLLADLYEYMDDRASEDRDSEGRYYPNEEMEFKGRLDEALDHFENLTLKQAS